MEPKARGALLDETGLFAGGGLDHGAAGARSVTARACRWRARAPTGPCARAAAQARALDRLRLTGASPTGSHRRPTQRIGGAALREDVRRFKSAVPSVDKGRKSRVPARRRGAVRFRGTCLLQARTPRGGALRALRGLLKRRGARRRAFIGGYHMLQPATPTDKPAARRRASRLLGLSLVLLTLALALPAGASAAAGWFTQSSGSTAFLTGVAFTDPTHGWAVASGGVILATTNGGATWSAQSSGTTNQLYAVAFSDAAHGWAVGDSGVILATTNGGATWSAQSSGSSEYLLSLIHI